MRQRTLAREAAFSGVGLHSGVPVNIRVLPAEAESGITFVRTDLGGKRIPVVPSSIAGTERSTTIRCGEAEVITVEHLLSALSGCGIDNALIELDACEVPILDGSALPYAEAFAECGTICQDSPRRIFRIPVPFEYTDPSGSYIRITPADRFEAAVTVHYDNPPVLRNLSASFAEGDDYPSQIAPCRTFCLFSEVAFLLSRNLIRGGSLGNAVVVMDDVPDDAACASVLEYFGVGSIAASRNGYLNNMELRFPDECARHKILDLMGDFTLLGASLQGRVEAFKPGHRVNAEAVSRLVAAYPEFFNEKL